MIYGLYGINDLTAGNYAAPFIASGDSEAIRMLKCDHQRALQDAPNSPFAMFIGDYNLYHLGTYDTESGLIKSDAIPSLILSGRSLLTPDDK